MTIIEQLTVERDIEYYGNDELKESDAGSLLKVTELKLGRNK